MNLDAPVRGDRIVEGGTIIVNDTVTQDIYISGDHDHYLQLYWSIH